MRKVPHEALSAFLTRETEVDTILTRLATLSAEHFNCEPDVLTWGRCRK
jgi:hypothetical protein